MIVIPLGTAAAVPSRERHLSSTALVCGRSTVLFDCGEGTQFRMLWAGIGVMRIKAIFITHLHGDHYFGLPGLLSTMTLLRREAPLTIVAPAALEAFLEEIPGLTPKERPFMIDYRGIDEGFSHAVVYTSDNYTVEARRLDHRVLAVGYRLQEKAKQGNLDVERARTRGVTDVLHYRMLKRGHNVVLPDGEVITPDDVVTPAAPARSFAYITDTRPCNAAVQLARRATLVYHEATFGEALQERAQQTGHATAREAAHIAREAGAERLILGHFSVRYKDVSPLVEEARSIFASTEAAVELEQYDLTEKQQ